jgi:Fic family protein
MARITGTHDSTTVAGEVVRAFIPKALPPCDPALDLVLLNAPLEAAVNALNRLEIAGAMIPDLDWFIYAFVRKEAVLSSQIEGTQATLLDLLNYEIDDDARRVPPTADVEEVCNYLEALKFARAQLMDPCGLPLSVQLLNKTHGLLMQGVRGAHKQPGEVRRSQNWIGGSRPGLAAHVPPPAHLLPSLLSDLERFIHAEHDALHPLLRIGLLHVQFETIHPYLDGNGRLGRLLITLLLEHWQQLSRPLLYLSLFFKQHRQEYYEHLTRVRSLGDWEGWLLFFLQGIATIAAEAALTAQRLFTLVAADRRELLSQPTITVAAIQLFERLPAHPMISAQWAIQTLGVSKPTALRAIDTLQEASILREITGKKRDRIFAYHGYLELLREGTELTTA